MATVPTVAIAIEALSSDTGCCRLVAWGAAESVGVPSVVKGAGITVALDVVLEPLAIARSAAVLMPAVLLLLVLSSFGCVAKCGKDKAGVSVADVDMVVDGVESAAVGSSADGTRALVTSMLSAG